MAGVTASEGRTCTRCHEWKDASWFRSGNSYKDGLFSRCRSCESAVRLENHRKNPDQLKWRQVRYKYGISKEDYERMVEEQGNACAICKVTEASYDHPRRRSGSSNKIERYWLHIDHDHETGEVRGLLCFKCNNGIGLLGTPEALREAANYLERKRADSSQ